MFTPFYKGRTCSFCQPNPERGPPTPSRTLPAPVNKASLRTLVVQCIPSAGLIGLLFGKTYPANLNNVRKFFQFIGLVLGRIEQNFISEYAFEYLVAILLAFESSRRDLHNALLCTALQSQNLPKFSKILR